MLLLTGPVINSTNGEVNTSIMCLAYHCV